MLWPWITDLKILGKTGIDSKHKADFASEGARDAYFLSKVLASPANLSSYTQLNTERPIQVEGSYEDLLAADMITFINHNLGNKRIYARIVEKNWVNTNCTMLRVEIDAYTTFMFDIEIESCYVRREMQSGDWAGGRPSYVNTTPEPYPVTQHTATENSYNGFGRSPRIVIAVTTEADGKSPVPGTVVGNIYSGCQLRVVTSAAQADAIIAEYAQQGNLDSIAAVFMAPFPVNNQPSHATIAAPGVPNNCAGYRPANAKLLTYPYTYLEASTLNGTTIQYDYALFENPQSPQFEVYDVPLPVPGLLYVPKNYRGMEEDYDNAIWLESNVQCIWSGNAFANWVGSNAAGLAVKLVCGALAAAAIATTAGAATPAVAFGTSALGAAAAGTGQAAQAAAKPSVARSLASGDAVPYVVEKFGVFFKAMTPTANEARRIDGAFTGIGYSTETTKKPNIRTRPYWNYVQTMNASISGALTASWIEQIENMLNAGVTFWHVDNGAQIGNYSMSNGG